MKWSPELDMDTIALIANFLTSGVRMDLDAIFLKGNNSFLSEMNSSDLDIYLLARNADLIYKSLNSSLEPVVKTQCPPSWSLDKL